MDAEQIRKPFTPAEAREQHSCVEDMRLASIPGEVFEAVDELIAVHYNPSGFKILQQDIIDKLKEKGIEDIAKVYKEKWLEFEPAYIAQGWKVSYDKPVGYAGEDFDPYFYFST